MHPSVLAKRKAQAVDSIVWTAGALAKQFELDPVLTDALQPKGVKDAAAAEMMRLEGLADLLMAVALQTGAVKESAPEPIEPDAVTAVTEPESKPTDESIWGIDLSEDTRPTLEDVPAHVVEPSEDNDFETKPKRRYTKRAKK